MHSQTKTARNGGARKTAGLKLPIRVRIQESRFDTLKQRRSLETQGFQGYGGERGIRTPVRFRAN